MEMADVLAKRRLRGKQAPPAWAADVLAKRRLRGKQPPPAWAAVGPNAAWLASLGQEETGPGQRWVYLVTISRVLPDTAGAADLRDTQTLTREAVAHAVRDSLMNPLLPLGGRRDGDNAEVVAKLAVFEERHSDHSKHFHVAVRLNAKKTFLPAKRAMRERHKLPSHWSCSHTQWWSALRYGVVPTPGKPAVDASPLTWSADGSAIDCFAESQEPFVAVAWRGQREAQDKAAAAAGVAMKFNKLDFNALVLSKSLRTRAQVLAFVQDHGTAAMQAWVARNQRHLDQHLAEAEEWGRARADAAEEELTDWARVCRAAERECQCVPRCGYADAAQEFFQRNAATVPQECLAAALRGVLVCGPSKTTRVPYLVGPTNTAKSTLLQPFVDIFGAAHVFSKPALSRERSAYALRNWLKGKHFVFWDDFNPVEYAEYGVIPVRTFLSAFNGDTFEVSVPQNVHDGNVEFRWARGAAFTCKLEGLWRPTPHVSEEDIRHLKSRVHVFSCAGVVPWVGDVTPCPVHLARWVVEGAARFDAAAAVRAPAVAPAGERAVGGLENILATAGVPEAKDAMEADLRRLGALRVQELTRADWEALPCWSILRPLERRRVLAALALEV